MDITQEQVCKLCGGKFTVLGILENAQSYWPELDILRCLAPCCSSGEELRIKTGQIERGYVYAAGAPHFASMEKYLVPNMVVSESTNGVAIKLNNYETTVYAKP